MPCQAADRRHRLKLVDDVPGDEVDVIVAELDADVADPLPPQLVELGVVHPLNALQRETAALVRVILREDSLKSEF